MGLPAKCMHFVGSPGWRGGGFLLTPETKSLFGASLNTTSSLINPPPRGKGHEKTPHGGAG